MKEFIKRFQQGVNSSRTYKGNIPLILYLLILVFPSIHLTPKASANNAEVSPYLSGYGMATIDKREEADHQENSLTTETETDTFAEVTSLIDSLEEELKLIQENSLEEKDQPQTKNSSTNLIESLEKELILIPESVYTKDQEVLSPSLSNQNSVSETENTLIYHLDEELKLIQKPPFISGLSESFVDTSSALGKDRSTNLIESLEEELTAVAKGDDTATDLNEPEEIELDQINQFLDSLEKELLEIQKTSSASADKPIIIPELSLETEPQQIQLDEQFLDSLEEELKALSQASEKSAPIASPSSSPETNNLQLELEEELSENLPHQLVIKPSRSDIPADGKSTVVIQGEFRDEQGKQWLNNSIVTLSSSSGTFIGEDIKPRSPGFQVEVIEGKFQGNLQAGNQAETVTIQAVGEGKETYTQVAFEANLPPSLATGIIHFRLGQQGTNFNEGFLNSHLEEGIQGDVSAYGAALITESIGDWLFTGKFNRDRATQDNPTQLSSDTGMYPVYGDNSVTSNRISSQDQISLRLEKPSHSPTQAPNVFFWGTYETSEFATNAQNFSATRRQLYGFKTNYHLDHLQLTGFYSEDLEGFERDAIAPNGTTGLYFLSQSLLIPRTEQVYIETEQLKRPGTVVSRKKLRRHRDYTIDYDRGTLLFKNPIRRTEIATDGSVLVQRIIINYQFENTANDTYIIGGRARYHFASKRDQKTWLGTSYIQEDQGRRDFSLFGLDSHISLGENGQLSAEYARSQMGSEDVKQVESQAYRLEILGQISPGVSGQAFWRTADPGFTNQATVSFVPGQTRYGANLEGKIGKDTAIRARYEQENNFGRAPQINNKLETAFNPSSNERVDNRLTTLSAGIVQEIGESQLTLDWIHRDREDEINDFNSNSEQLRSRLNVPITDQITAYALNETTLSAQTDAVFSDRSAIGLGWEIAPEVELGASQQWFTSGQLTGQAITRIDLGGNHHLSDDTTVIGHYAIAEGTNGTQSQAALGVNHQFAILPGINLDLGYERIFGENNHQNLPVNQPFTLGQSASALGFHPGETYQIGVEYTDNPNWKAKARLEHRSHRNYDNTIISSRLSGQLTEELTALARYHQASPSNPNLKDLDDTVNIRLGLAYRDPNQDQWNALLKYEYRQNPSTLPSSLLEGSGSGSTGQIFSAEAIYSPNWQWELYGKYALGDSTTFLAEDFEADSQISVMQFRASHRFAQQWEMLGEAQWVEQPSGNFRESSASLELGYYLTSNLRLVAGYSWGELSNPDSDRAVGSPFLTLTYKVNELLNRFQEEN